MDRQSSFDRSDKVFLLLVLAALAAAVFLALMRDRIERGNRTVALIVDSDDARTAAAAAGLPMPDFLAALREAGASALAVREITVGELVRSGRLLAMSVSGRTNLATRDRELGPVLREAMKARLPHVRAAASEAPFVLSLDVGMDQLDTVPVLLRPEDLRAARGAGLPVVARLLNFPASSPGAVQAAAAEAQAAGARLVVFGEEEVLGYDGLLRETAEAFRRHDLLYGYVEMAGQQGDDTLARLLRDRVVRVHSISDSDMLTISPDVAVPRFARAVRERNIRACYVRLLLRSSRDPAAVNVAYLKRIADALRAEGFRIGPPAPFRAPRGYPPRSLRLLVALGLPAALLLLLRRLAPIPFGWAWGTFAILLAAGVAVGTARPNLVVPLGGLATAVVFPTLALVWLLQAARGSGTRLPVSLLLGASLFGLAAASAVSVGGALLIVGLYSRVGYLNGIDRFAGVKIAYLVPLALVAAAVIADLPGRAEPLSLWWRRARLRVTQFLGRPILVIEAAVAFAALAAIVFSLTRTGNQPLVIPSGAELKLRGLLESLLVVRPRTKELLLGHPALMLAVALSLRGRRAWLPVVALLACVGQVSLVNTFCHLHTPLYVSFLRTGHGLWIGAAVGVVTILVWRLLLDRPPRKAAP